MQDLKAGVLGCCTAGQYITPLLIFGGHLDYLMKPLSPKRTDCLIAF